MHSVNPVTFTTPSEGGLGIKVPRQDVRHRVEIAGRPDWTGARVRAALARANQPLRARALAHILGLPAVEVKAALRRLQDLGAAASHDRRWTAVTEP
ncbi:conserved hypothetical protein [Frankia canadensis]|uniref:Transcriptional regulator n=1 Tax=Frankia canadensis TaxID=1836972 RepID=A0A2I2KWR4_9ACTN|nr:conserved hypothetical protein [Frankia canadensis]SOU57385.1 conserved hypothetical protein [Frankia canadensis]